MICVVFRIIAFMPGVIDIIKTGVWKSTGGCLIRRKQAVPLFMTTERFGVSEIMSAPFLELPVRKIRRLREAAGFSENLFAGFFEDDFRKIFVNFSQVPGIARQKHQFAVVVFSQIQKGGIAEFFKDVFIRAFNPAGRIILGSART